MTIEPVFASRAMHKIFALAKRVAPTSASVVITGETGCGKEVVSDLIHRLSTRKDRDFVKLNCSAFPKDLIESELFGSAKGSFTGSVADRTGLFELADGGTILLDELAEMPIEMQPKLLRVLQDHEVRPVGGRRSKRVDVRVIATLNANPTQCVAENRLREDLYYRISTVCIHIPPLRERVDDIVPMAEAYVAAYSAEMGTALSLANDAKNMLRYYRWPGNVRQLQNEIHRACILCEGQCITAKDLSLPNTGPSRPKLPALLSPMEASEKALIESALRDTRSKYAAAKKLGIARATLYNKIELYSIEVHMQKARNNSRKFVALNGEKPIEPLTIKLAQEESNGTDGP